MHLQVRSEVMGLASQLTEAEAELRERSAAEAEALTELKRKLTAAETARDAARRESAGLRADLATLATGPASVFQRTGRGQGKDGLPLKGGNWPQSQVRTPKLIRILTKLNHLSPRPRC